MVGMVASPAQETDAFFNDSPRAAIQTWKITRDVSSERGQQQDLWKAKAAQCKVSASQRFMPVAP